MNYNWNQIFYKEGFSETMEQLDIVPGISVHTNMNETQIILSQSDLFIHVFL